MAQKVKIRLLSDLELAKNPDSEAEASQTRRFSVDGEGFEIDLSDSEAEAFDKAIAPYKDAARPVGRAGRTKGQGRPARAAKAAKPAVDTVAVREWARENGIDIKDRGRVPGDIVAKYEAAQGA
jgi:hypothetical protein